VQLRLESPVAALPGQRLIIRSYSPQATIGGGSIVDILPQKHRKRDIPPTRDFLTKATASIGDEAAWIRVLINNAGMQGIALGTLRCHTGLVDEHLTKPIEAALEDGSIKEGGG